MMLLSKVNSPWTGFWIVVFWTILSDGGTEAASIGKISIVDGDSVPVDPMIIGGSFATRGQFPWQAVVWLQAPEELDGPALCGGSLINPRYVLSAAHCFFYELDGVFYLRTNISVSLGALKFRLTVADPGRESYVTHQSIIHPCFTIGKVPPLNDIALIVLPDPVTVPNPGLWDVIRLPVLDVPLSYAGYQGTASGWGIYNMTIYKVSPDLKYTTMPVISNTDCAKTYNKNLKGNQMICTDTNSTLGIQSTCRGDSGGPLYITEADGQPTLVGITSWGLINCEAGAPTVFTRVSYFLPWLRRVAPDLNIRI